MLFILFVSQWCHEVDIKTKNANYYALIYTGLSNQQQGSE